MRQIADASQALGGPKDAHGLLTLNLDRCQRFLKQLRALNEPGVSSGEIPPEQIVTCRILLGAAAISPQTDAATARKYRALEKRLREMP